MRRAPALVLMLCVALAGCSKPIRETDETDPGKAVVKPVDRTTTARERPVRIGFDGPRFDACASFATVTNIGPGEDDRLTVRNAPAGSAEEVDALPKGAGVAMCQRVGGWIGIVYAPDGGETGACGTGSPVATVRDYDGPCRSGWVRDDYLKLIAG